MHGPGYASDTYIDVALKKNVRSAQMNTFHPAMKYIQSADKWRLNMDKKNVYKRMKYHKTRRCGGWGGICPRYYRHFSCASLTPIISKRDSKNGPQRVTAHWICIGANIKKGAPGKGAFFLS